MVKICKFYVSGCCNKKDCNFQHINNICPKHFFKVCDDICCNMSHKYKLIINNRDKNKDNRENNNEKHQYKIKSKIKNTESFKPDLSNPNLLVRLSQPIINGNEISIINNINWKPNIIENILKEVPNDVYKLWHGDSHCIADDSLKWKENSPTFNYVVDELCKYFNMTASATRLNYYKNGSDWKPYHHDAAALKPHKAKTQNITVGVSFGITRSISFQSAKSYERIDFPLEDGNVYAFGNQVNIDYKHGIVQIENGETFGERISIIIWGFSNNLSLL